MTTESGRGGAGKSRNCRILLRVREFRTPESGTGPDTAANRDMIGLFHWWLTSRQLRLSSAWDVIGYQLRSLERKPRATESAGSGLGLIAGATSGLPPGLRGLRFWLPQLLQLLQSLPAAFVPPYRLHLYIELHYGQNEIERMEKSLYAVTA
jgi:hypothetical protein